MTAPWNTLLAMGAAALLYVLAPIVLNVFSRFRREHAVRCPEADAEAEVRIDPVHAARTAVPGPPVLTVVRCSLWPERQGCAQRCVEQL